MLLIPYMLVKAMAGSSSRHWGFRENGRFGKRGEMGNGLTITRRNGREFGRVSFVVKG
jgi:hypothetical protein